MDQGRTILVWCTICLILCGQSLTKDGTKNNNDENGAVEVEDDEGVLQQLDEALDSGIITETELTHTLKNTFKISEKEWRNLVQQHDADGDGKLAADELLSVAEYLTKKHGEWPIEEKQPLNGAWTGAYVVAGVIFLYIIYAGWKHRQENVGTVHGPGESALREARLAALSRGHPSHEESNQRNTVKISNEREVRSTMNRDEQVLRRRRFGDDNDCQDPAKKRLLADKRNGTEDSNPHLTVQDSNHCENEAATHQTEDTSASNSNRQADLEGNSRNIIIKSESLPGTISDASSDVSSFSSPPHETTKNVKSSSNRPTKFDGVSGNTFGKPKSKSATISSTSSDASPSSSPSSETAQTTKSNSDRPTKLEGISGKTLVKPESMSSTVSSASSSSLDVSPSLSPSSDTTKTFKKSSPRKSDGPRKDAHPNITGEDLLLYVLSTLFNLKVEIRKSNVKTGWVPGTMSIKVTDLPGGVEDVHMKMFVLFERRLSRHYSSKVKFCVSCFYNCLDLKGYYTDEIVNKMISTASSLCISTILQQLQEEEEETNDEDDLYSDLAHSSESFEKMEIVSFLLRVAGWSDDGVNISLDLLNEIVTYATKNENATQAMAKVLKSAGNVLKSVQRLDELQLIHGKTLKGLEHLLSQPALPELLSKIFDKEVDQSSSSLGIYFQRQSVLGSLLSITTIPPSLVEGTKMNSPALQPWITLRGFPQRPNYDELKNLESRMQDQLHIIQQLVFSVLKRMMKSNRETALAWLATLISMNEMRTSVSPQIQPVASNSIQATCSDGYMLNICAVLIELCLPFCKGDITKLDKIDASYSASSACRLNYDFETCLAGGQIVQERDNKNNTRGRIPESLRGRFNFMTEILHLTVRAMNVGFLPAKSHYSKLQQQLMHTIKAVTGNKSAEADIRAKHLAFSLQWETHLLDPEILRKGSELYLTLAVWLQLQLEKSAKGANGEAETEKRQRKVFSQIPEHCVKDMAQWFWFIASHGLMVHPRALAGLQLAPFVDVCVYLLRRPDLVPGPIPAYRITQALLAFVSTSNRNSAQQRGWGSGVISELAAMVHACPTVQEHLGPALLHNYISVDVVEGLDVDKEDFDKYSARAEIARLLQNLWERLDCRSSVLKLCGSEKFQSFLGAIIDTLLYQLHDSLARLANVRKLERSREDEAAWNALSYKEQEASETFRKNEERVATGFMSMARETLGLIDLISKSEEVARCFTIMPLARRAASTFIGFLESLCGSKSASFKVKDMEKYRFNPRELLSQIAQILLRIVHEERSRELHFVKSMAADPDYSPATMQKACNTLRSKNILEETAVKEFETLNEEVSILREAIQAESLSPSSGGNSDDWQSVIDKEQIDEAELENSYTEEMGDFRFDSAELQDNHCYQSNATHALDARSRQAKALIKEMKQWAEILPVHPHAAVFVRQDEERMDMVRALVTGPRDTPYSLGCFVFDIYFPSQYPNIPPLVKFTTTGNGTVRFNPNLYADGKVCLSLLGTFYSGDSSQKWQPNTSSLYQVMVSIQSMILIPDPMYNEPGYEGMRDTQEGEARSREYNAKLRLMTVRHAMLGQLRNPPVGFEEVIRKHFRLQYKAVLKQCSQWLRESEAGDEERKLRRVIDELRSELKKLTDQSNTENVERQDEGNN